MSKNEFLIDLTVESLKLYFASFLFYFLSKLGLPLDLSFSGGIFYSIADLILLLRLLCKVDGSISSFFLPESCFDMPSEMNV